MSASTVFVFDPVTGGHARLAIPPELPKVFVNGTVLCTAGDNFKVVLVSMFENDRRRLTACVYSSRRLACGEISSSMIVVIIHVGLLKSNCQRLQHPYWFISFEIHVVPEPAERHGVLEFDLDRQIITIMKGSPINRIGSSVIIKTVDDGVGLVTLHYWKLELQVWHRDLNCHDVAAWVLFKKADLHSILGLQWNERWPEPTRRHGIFGYDEDDNVIFIYVDSSLFVLQLDTMQFKMHDERLGRRYLGICHPFRIFYTAGDPSSLVLINNMHYGGKHKDNYLFGNAS
jgi:hypothetical protein